MRGIFTKTLLLGLNGAAAEPKPENSDEGIITANSLKSYLYQNMKEFIDPEFRNDPDIQEPDIDYFPKANDGRDIIIKTVPLKKFPALLKVPSGASGIVTIIDDKLQPVDDIPINDSPV